MSKLLTTVCAVLLLVTCAHAFRSGIVKIFGNHPRQRNNAMKCASEGEECLTDARCCSGFSCSYSIDGSSLYGQCKAESQGNDGKSCYTDEDCGLNYCCQMETVGYRGFERRVCRYKPFGSCYTAESPAAVDPGYYSYYKWRTMRRRGRKRTVA